MKIIETVAEMGHEQLVFCQDSSSGYRGIIAIHNSRRGPAVGGTRFWNYAQEEDAIIDALRLARGMTYKNAVAGVPYGGGKSVIIGDNKTPVREPVFRAHGRFIERLGGRYITAEDVGTTPADMDFVRLETPHVFGFSNHSGDPSPQTARGVFRAIQASAKVRWGSDDLTGKRVVIQGCGNVGSNLVRELQRAGAKLTVSDIDPAKAGRVVKECGAEEAAPDDVFNVAADIFSPCGLGAIINDETIPKLRVEIVAGAANNQLLEARHGEDLEKRGIVYAPDYVANAGGVIGGCGYVLGWGKQLIAQKIDAIYDRLLEIFSIALREKIPASLAADRLAERILADGLRP